jgi:hypothetical protein
MDAMQLKGNLGDADASFGYSPNIWGDCPIKSILEGSMTGIIFEPNLAVGGLITSPTTSAALVGKELSGFGSSGATITYSDTLGGGIVLAETTDDESVAVFSLSHAFQMGLTKRPLWFEARVTPSATATTEQAMFVGLCDSTAKTVIVPLIAAAGALADLNCVGFHKLDTDLTSIKTAYKADGVTAVTVQTKTSALTAATAVRLGFKKDRNGLITFYINNVKQTGQFQTINDLGTGFPGDVTLAPCIAMHLGAAASDNTLAITRWRCVQLI